MCISGVLPNGLTRGAVSSPQLLAYRSSSPSWPCATPWFLRRMATTSSTRPPPQVRPLGRCALLSPSLETWVFAVTWGRCGGTACPTKSPLSAAGLTQLTCCGCKCANHRKLVLAPPDSVVILGPQQEALSHLAFPSRSQYTGQSCQGRAALASMFTAHPSCILQLLGKLCSALPAFYPLLVLWEPHSTG